MVAWLHLLLGCLIAWLLDCLAAWLLAVVSVVSAAADAAVAATVNVIDVLMFLSKALRKLLILSAGAAGERSGSEKHRLSD